MPKKGKKSLDRKYKGKNENESQKVLSSSQNNDVNEEIVPQRSTEPEAR